MIKKIMRTMERFDLYLFQRFHASHTQSFNTLAVLLTRLGDGPVYAIAVPIALFLSFDHPVALLGVFLLAMGVEKVSYYLLARYFKRQRPFLKLANQGQGIAPPNEFSFPSGHSSSAFCMATLLSHYFATLTWVFYATAAAIALSRLVLKVHFPLDLIAGSTLGFICAYAVLCFFP